MKNLESFLTRHPVLSVIILTISWFILAMLSAGITSSLLNQEFGDTAPVFLGHISAIIFIVLLLWKLDWLKAAGITRSGTYQAWLLALIGIIYFVPASLYSFFGSLSFNFSNLVNLPLAGNVILRNLAICISEEMFFRGTVLLILVRVWGNTEKGLLGSVTVMSLIFALMHVVQAFSGLSGTSILLLVFEVIVISTWWGALVLKAKSIWPAFAAHFMGNIVIALQANSVSVIEPHVHAYTRLLLFSIPLGFGGIWLLFLTFKRQTTNNDLT